MKVSTLEFLPINLETHQGLSIRFREDAFLISFGNADRFHEADGKGSERYVDWLKNKIARDPASVVHVWLGDQIVGQMEMGQYAKDSPIGYVNLYYLIPPARGKGYSSQLEQYTMSYMKEKGYTQIRLSVAPSNARAISFYRKNGWQEIGINPDYPAVLFMEKTVS